MKNFQFILLLFIFFSCDNNDIIDSKKLKSSSFQNKSANNCPYVTVSYKIEDADYIVDRKEDLQSVINNANPNEIIYIKNDVRFDFNDQDCQYLNSNCYSNANYECYFIIIDKPLKLVSGRSNNSNGAILSSNKPGAKLIRVESDNVLISGLTIQGNDFDIGDAQYIPSVTDGIFICNYNNLSIENCEISGWSQAGIHLKNSIENKIINNYIHHNRRTELGYGVSLNTIDDNTSNALISCNYFEYNRHDITGSGNKNESYEASFNTVGLGGAIFSHSFDMHGDGEYENDCINNVAGNLINIHDNKFNNKSIPAFRIRGIPNDHVKIFNNIFAHSSECEAIKQSICSHLQSSFNTSKIKISNNSYNDHDQIDFSNQLLYLNNNDNIIKYSFSDRCEYPTTISKGWSNYTEFLVGNWTNNGTDDLVAYHKRLDELHLYKYRYDGTGFYSGYKKISHGWSNYTEFLVGNWTNNGTDDLIAYHERLDELHLYKYHYDGTRFYSGYTKVSHGWSNYTEFLVGNWTNNGTDDLIAYHKGLDELHLYKYHYDGTRFYSGYTKVSHGWSNYTEFLVGNWSNNKTDDLIAYHEGLDELHLYKFRDDKSEFYSGYEILRNDLKSFKKFLVNDLNQNGRDDLIGINTNNELYILMKDGEVVNIYIGLFSDLKFLLSGKWK